MQKRKHQLSGTNFIPTVKRSLSDNISVERKKSFNECVLMLNQQEHLQTHWGKIIKVLLIEQSQPL